MWLQLQSLRRFLIKQCTVPACGFAESFYKTFLLTCSIHLLQYRWKDINHLDFKMNTSLKVLYYLLKL